jgi:hypothetical protein
VIGPPGAGGSARGGVLGSQTVSLLATNYTPISIISVISLVGGYGGLWLLWRLVFSSKRTHDDTLDRARRDAALKTAAPPQDAAEPD